MQDALWPGSSVRITTWLSSRRPNGSSVTRGVMINFTTSIQEDLLLTKNMAASSLWFPKDLQKQPASGMEHAIGRLLQVQFAVRGQTDCYVNSFNIYQHSWTKAPQVMSRRKQIWESLAAGLDVVPMRHSLIVAGDFNSTCQPNTWVCGHNALVPQDLPEDNEDFCNLLEAYGLTACNTWMRRHGAATFEFGKIQSQLDYILLRRLHADAISRQASVIHDFEVDAHRDGARHFPVHTSFSIRRRPWQHADSPAPRINQVQMANDAVHDKLGRVDNLCKDVQHALAVRSDSNLSDVNDIIQAACIKHFPAHNGSRKGSVWQDDLMPRRANRMWQHFRQTRACEQTRAGIFKARRHWSKFRQTQHAHVRHGRELRKAKQIQIMQDASG